MAPGCHTQYYGDHLRTKLLLERVILFEKVLEKLPAFHDRLVAIEWQCFTSDHCKVNEQWIQEFYANLRIVSFSDPSIRIIKIRGKEVDFREEQINDIYGIL